MLKTICQYAYKLFKCTYTFLWTYCVKKRCNLDAIIYNKITSIVNIIRSKLFTVISIVYKYGTLENVCYIYT